MKRTMLSAGAGAVIGALILWALNVLFPTAGENAKPLWFYLVFAVSLFCVFLLINRYTNRTGKNKKA